jgi:hypothetical protein
MGVISPFPCWFWKEDNCWRRVREQIKCRRMICMDECRQWAHQKEGWERFDKWLQRAIVMCWWHRVPWYRALSSAYFSASTPISILWTVRVPPSLWLSLFRFALGFTGNATPESWPNDQMKVAHVVTTIWMQFTAHGKLESCSVFGGFTNGSVWWHLHLNSVQLEMGLMSVKLLRY